MTNRWSLVVLLTCAMLCVACGRRGGGGGGTTEPGADAGSLCGDGVREAAEPCDGADLGGMSCAALGYEGGTLSCSGCALDTSECVGTPADSCGNGSLDVGEICDGANLGGATCDSLGIAGGGALTCALDCSSFDTALCGTGAADGPRILSFDTDVSSLTEGGRVVFSLVATDPDGIDDLIGGTLRDPASGHTYGALATASAEGAYQIDLDWARIHAVRPIVFTTPESRAFEAEVFDVAGHRSVARLSLTLSCGDGAACDGRCESLRSSSACGSCGNVCASPTMCTEGSSGWSCGCRAGEALCGGACVSVETNTNCGACGRRCSSDAYCDTTPAGPACVCSAGRLECGGACVAAIDDAHCGACGNVCPSGTRCQEVGGAPVCTCFGSSGDTYCGGACVYLDTPTNCGACGRACSASQVCGLRLGSDSLPSCLPRYDVELPAQTIRPGGAPTDFEFTGVPLADVPLTLTITAAGDFDEVPEWASVYAGGDSLDYVGRFDAPTCGWTTLTYTLSSGSIFVSSRGTVTVRLDPESSVGACGTINQVRMRLAM